MKHVRLLWGTPSESRPTAPIHYPLLPVLVFTAAIAPTTWFLPRQRGYFISLLTILAIIAYTVMLTDLRLRTDPVFLLLFGGYWFGLVAHYLLHSPHPELLEYILVTPIAVFATVIVLPRLVRGREQTFTMGLTGVAVIISLVGIWYLWRITQGEPITIMGSTRSRWVGTAVMGFDVFDNMRTVSVFHNPNTYGLFMMIGSLTALYTLITRGGLVWATAFGLCVLGLFMSEGDAAYLGFGLGALIVVSGYRRWLAVGGILVGVVATYGMIRIGHVPAVMESTLLNRVDRWVLSLERIAEDPLWGIGFVDAGTEIGGARGPHNSFVHALLNAGIIAGVLYLGALAYALGRGIRRRWTAWTAYVVGSSVALFTFMSFESLFLGGLSVSSVALGFFLGCCLLSESDRQHNAHRARTTRQALANSRLARLYGYLRRTARSIVRPATPGEDQR